LHVVSFHTGDPFSNAESEARYAQYSVFAIPTNVYDGGYQSDNFFNEAKLNTSGVRSVHNLGMSLSQAIDGSTLWFKGSVSNLESASFNGFVLVFIVENGLVDPAYPTVTWNFVFRAYGLNKTLNMPPSSTESFNGSWIIPSWVNASNVETVAAAYDASTKDPTYGSPYAVQSVCNLCGHAADDVGTTSVTPSKTVVGQGFSMNLSCQVANYGDNTETVNVTAYVNMTFIQNRTIPVQSGLCGNVTFSWNTAAFAKGNYTLSCSSQPVPGETDTADNNFTDGMVYVGVPGDVDGNHKVNVIDILMVAKAFGTNSQSSNWNPNMDVDCNNKVDVIDILITAKNFGKTDP
jgi:hypothetical protein